jgi:DNA-binding transcriptional MerR regulator
MNEGVITPAHIDPESGYRYYSRDNMLRLRTILGLKDAGLSLLESEIIWTAKAYGEKDRRAHGAAGSAQPGDRESANSRDQTRRPDGA